jgi:AraC family transcriptional regulator
VDELILNQLADPLPVEEWAKRVGMSRRSFENAFSKETGMTPYAYLMHLRVEEAKRLLKECDWTVARIGQAVGIPDPPRFSAFFKKNTGLTASEWRNGEAGRQTYASGSQRLDVL